MPLILKYNCYQIKAAEVSCPKVPASIRRTRRKVYIDYDEVIGKVTEIFSLKYNFTDEFSYIIPAST